MVGIHQFVEFGNEKFMPWIHFMKTYDFWRKGLKSEEFGRKEKLNREMSKVFSGFWVLQNRDCLSQKMNLHKTSLGTFSRHTIVSYR